MNNNQQNPFEAIESRFNSLESLVLDIKHIVTDNKVGKQHNEDEILGVKEACDLLSLAPATIYALTSSRKLPHSKRGKKLYFKKSELIQWIQAGKRNTKSEIWNKAKDFNKIPA